MARWLSAELRQTIADRAKQRCEYCLIAEVDTFYGCEVDHIISLKHGGSSDFDNLAYACALCNRAKGSDIGSISMSGMFTRFFNPRVDHWSEHFRLEGSTIRSLTIIARSLPEFWDSMKVRDSTNDRSWSDWAGIPNDLQIVNDQ